MEAPGTMTKPNNKPEKSGWDKVKPYVELTGVIILAVYTFLTFMISGANTEAAKAATQTTKDTRAFFMVDERAWVVLDIAPIKSDPASRQFDRWGDSEPGKLVPSVRVAKHDERRNNRDDYDP
jgi:hypothetical protein